MAGVACASELMEREVNPSIDYLDQFEVDEMDHVLVKRDADPSAYQSGSWSRARDQSTAGSINTKTWKSSTDILNSYTPGSYAFDFAKRRYYSPWFGSTSFNRFRSDFFRKYGYYPSRTVYENQFEDLFGDKFFNRFGALTNAEISRRFGHLSSSEFFQRYGFYPPLNYRYRYRFGRPFWW